MPQAAGRTGGAKRPPPLLKASLPAGGAGEPSAWDGRQRSSGLVDVGSELDRCHIAVATDGRASGPAPLPEGWKSAVGPGTGRLYYYHERPGRFSGAGQRLSLLDQSLADSRHGPTCFL